MAKRGYTMAVHASPKTDLLVFNKKEILIIIVLLILVALFSFTLGVRMGKSLGGSAKGVVSTPVGEEHAPLKAHQEEHEPAAEVEEEAHNAEAPASKSLKTAENRADEELVGEVEKNNVGVSKPLTLNLPKDKKGEGSQAVRYTLQVGSHRTVAEAAEQVSGLKKQNIDAFYLEAKVPGKGTWYRVGIGTFSNKEDAERTAVKWKDAKHLPPYIVQKITIEE